MHIGPFERPVLRRSPIEWPGRSICDINQIMVAVLAVSTLIQAAARVGVELVEVDKGGNLYVWHTPLPERAVVYIGKSASDKRVADEGKWREGDPRNTIDIGLVTLLRVNRATPQALHYDPNTFDSSKWRTHRDAREWGGGAFDYLDDALADHAGPDAAEVEKLLVRIAVRYGVPIGNSQFGSQWEGPIGTIPDTLAALAIDSDPSFVIPDPYTVSNAANVAGHDASSLGARQTA